MKFDVSDLQAEPHVLVEDVTNDKSFPIAVDYKAATDKWTVRCTDSGRTVEAPALCEALHKLANEYEAHDLYDSDKFDADATEAAGRTKKCAYCAGRIFFAETINGKWMPIDFESVPATMLGSTLAYTLTAVNGGARAPQARRITRRYQGQVWIAHQNVCGSRPESPDSPYLRQRWEKNRGVTVKATNDAVHDLARMASTIRNGQAA